MAKLYTGNGDGGYTETVTDRHISKSDILIELIGTVDEISSSLGVAKAHTADAALRGDIDFLQRELMLFMGGLAGGKNGITEKNIRNIEEMTDRYCAGFEGFSVPGANAVSAFLDLARCVVRRGERIAVRAAEQNRTSPTELAYINRLSDLVYAMSRYAENNN